MIQLPTREPCDLCVAARPPIRRVALAIDAREAAFLRAVPAVIDDLRRRELDVRVLFLDCATDVLVNRYRETRRVHPLSPGGSVEEGVETERRLLVEIAELADLRLDTSELNVHELRETVARAMAGKGAVIVTPGVRPLGTQVGDQRRVATPAEAIRAGASILVVGRPIHEAEDPAEAARRIVAEIAAAEAT